MSDFARFLSEALEQSKKDREQSGQAPLQAEARLGLLREVYDTFQSGETTDQPEVGDVVVQKGYLGAHIYPNHEVPGILHEVWDEPKYGYELQEGNQAYALEQYNCTVAVLHPTKDGATLMFVPMNLRRLKRKDLTVEEAAD